MYRAESTSSSHFGIELRSTPTVMAGKRQRLIQNENCCESTIRCT